MSSLALPFHDIDQLSVFISYTERLLLRFQVADVLLNVETVISEPTRHAEGHATFSTHVVWVDALRGARS